MAYLIGPAILCALAEKERLAIIARDLELGDAVGSLRQQIEARNH